MLFPIPISHFPLPTSHLPAILPKAAINKTGPSWLLRSFRRHKRVRVVCGAAVEEDRRQIQSSTLPKRTSGTLTRQHYSTASIHSTLPPPPPLPLAVDTAHAAAVTAAAPLTPLALHTSASPTAPHCLLRLSRQNSPTVAREHLETREGYLTAVSATACTT